MKILAKSNKIELSEEFMAMWREEETLWNALSPMYCPQTKMKKTKV